HYLLPPKQPNAFSEKEKASWCDKKDKRYVLRQITSYTSYKRLFFLVLSENRRTLKEYLSGMPAPITGSPDGYDGVDSDCLSIKEQILWLQKHIVNTPDD